jgi:ubiquinone/menaquinone biosynthesis C-methylase UbiE
MEVNQQAYSSADTVAEYAGHSGLQKGEMSIVQQFGSKISGGRVLDIGIGAGRTSEHLIPMAKEYIGLDFSKPFVEYCQKKFADKKNATIQYGDARNIDFLPDHSFDFVLFSFNGIDCVDYDGRQQILSEFSRLIKDDGILSYSFHNKGNIDKLYSFQLPRNPLKYIWEWQRMHQVKTINGDKEIYKSKDWFIIKDGCENFTTDIFYADPLYEMRSLQKVGFNTFFFHDSVSGQQLNISDVQKANGPWIYITAQK